MEPSYRIIGGDGQEYGPASRTELIAWVKEGRVAPATKVWCSEDARWLPAKERVEMREALAGQPGIAATLDATGEIRAGFWVRAAAFLFDQLLLGFVIRMVATPPEFLLRPPSDLSELLRLISLNAQAVGAYLAIQLIIAGIYFTMMTGQFGATLGKLLLGLRVVRVDGSPVGFGLAFGRFLASQLSQLLCLGGYFVAAFRNDRRALHDLIAGTRVIYRRDLFDREN